MDAIVKARVDSSDKDAAIAVLEQLGLRLSDLIRMTIIQTARLKTLPFAQTMQAENIQALDEIETGTATRMSHVIDIDLPVKKIKKDHR